MSVLTPPDGFFTHQAPVPHAMIASNTVPYGAGLTGREPRTCGSRVGSRASALYRPAPLRILGGVSGESDVTTDGACVDRARRAGESSPSPDGAVLGSGLS